MRYAAHILVLGALVLSGTISNAKADDQTHPAVPQAQMAVPKDNPLNENSKDRKPDQSAEAPNQSPAVIAPPATGDQNIIPPPTCLIVIGAFASGVFVYLPLLPIHVAPFCAVAT
jgi:outer membrane murein-binding lipoprotein Lpp